MPGTPNSPQQYIRSNGTSPPTDRDIGDYTECMLRALERLAQTNGHEVLAKLLRLACAEAKRLKARHSPGT